MIKTSVSSQISLLHKVGPRRPPPRKNQALVKIFALFKQPCHSPHHTLIQLQLLTDVYHPCSIPLRKLTHLRLLTIYAQPSRYYHQQLIFKRGSPPRVSSGDDIDSSNVFDSYTFVIASRKLYHDRSLE